MHFQPIHSFEWQVGNFHDPSAEGTLGKVARQNLRHVIYLTWITRTLGNYCPILQLEYIRNHICWQTSNTGCWLASNLYWFDGWFSLHLHWKYIYTSSRQNCWSWPTFVMSRIWRRIASSIWDLSQNTKIDPMSGDAPDQSRLTSTLTSTKHWTTNPLVGSIPLTTRTNP